MEQLPPPIYAGSSQAGIALAVESMKRHTPTDEGWQIMAALQHAGYELAGNNLPINETDVGKILRRTNAGVVVLQDKREWDVKPGEFRSIEDRFENVGVLRQCPELFKLTILKDAHSRPEYHRESAEEIGCHAWIIYYNPVTVHNFAPFTRPQHLIRTYHSVDADLVPVYTKERKGCLLSGAVSAAYPWRQRLVNEAYLLPDLEYLPHPGYSVNGTHTPNFLQILSRFKVSICTASAFQYTLRKFVESTACGCVVLTNLREKMPEIDGNFYRVPDDIPTAELAEVLREIYDEYDPERQRYFADKAKTYYDYRAVGLRLANDIETMRAGYHI